MWKILIFEWFLGLEGKISLALNVLILGPTKQATLVNTKTRRETTKVLMQIL